MTKYMRILKSIPAEHQADYVAIGQQSGIMPVTEQDGSVKTYVNAITRAPITALVKHIPIVYVGDAPDTAPDGQVYATLFGWHLMADGAIDPTTGDQWQAR